MTNPPAPRRRRRFVTVAGDVETEREETNVTTNDYVEWDDQDAS